MPPKWKDIDDTTLNPIVFAPLGVFTKRYRVEPLGENTKRGGNAQRTAGYRFPQSPG